MSGRTWYRQPRTIPQLAERWRAGHMSAVQSATCTDMWMAARQAASNSATVLTFDARLLAAIEPELSKARRSRDEARRTVRYSASVARTLAGPSYVARGRLRRCRVLLAFVAREGSVATRLSDAAFARSALFVSGMPRFGASARTATTPLASTSQRASPACSPSRWGARRCHCAICTYSSTQIAAPSADQPQSGHRARMQCESRARAGQICSRARR